MNGEPIFQWDKKKRLIHKMTHTKARMTREEYKISILLRVPKCSIY